MSFEDDGAMIGTTADTICRSSQTRASQLKGEFIRKGSLSADGDVEFYDDQPDPTANEKENQSLLGGGETAAPPSSSGQQGQQ
jgi:hypothetical protein